ncbi:hypothetical protein BU23DRAFT_555024 [Bimuria novae-zelandiae CBS 107.79]|uniref:Uncharacterized protein n=1 Tax=Bimuria novae-zelandiae CBS 107.79 TaxID=1447943 RepID=A0A6A5V732_9PLEO|nr:hypothetical protein BU23DRAFT_555024 [Bimuria novae-zelandiae CBS 107.79]
MATPTPNPTPTAILTPDQRLALEQRARYASLTRTLAIGGLIACPTLALLPPRKLDLYTLSLAIGFYLSADHLTQSSYNRPVISYLIPSSPFPTDLPTDKAREVSRVLREKEAVERARREGVSELGGEKEGRKNNGVLTRIWMGEEEEGWKEKRMEEERRAREEGKGYGEMILEQIWEVWNWGDKKEQKGKREGEGKKE